MEFDFEALYARYPRPEGKRRGMEKLKKTIKTEADYSAFSSAVDAYIKLCQTERRERKFIKLWQTFVNNWTDYLSQKTEVKSAMETQMARIINGDL